MTDSYERDPEMTPGDKIRGAIILMVLGGLGLFFLVRELFF